MLTTAYYFLQVILCSGLMMGYYWLVLRNKRFHQYNRFYLLAITLLSWIVPLIKIQLNHAPVAEDAQMMQFLYVVADNNSLIDQSLSKGGFEWSAGFILAGLYGLVSAVFLFLMVRVFTRLYRLLKTHSCKNVGDVYLILTTANGTPFSFFRYIFWNEEIDIRTETGKQILQHELTHVQQKHSIDKVFMQVVLVAGWFNPFFWLVKKEMDMIHEFIADKKAINNGDTASLAQMLLTAAYPQQKFAMTNPFFFSPIKRRLQMLTENRNPRFSYIRRLIILPLLALVTVLFAFRSKNRDESISVASVMENVYSTVKDGFGEKSSTDLTVSDISLTLADGSTVSMPDTTVYIRQKDVPLTEKTVGASIRKSDLDISDYTITIDGVKTDKATLETLSPDRIKSVSVMKPKTFPGDDKTGNQGLIAIITKDPQLTQLMLSGTMRSDAYALAPAGLRDTVSEVVVTGYSNRPSRYTDTVYKIQGILADQPVVYVDGEKSAWGSVKPADVAYIRVYKGASAIEKYGEDGKNGAIEITTMKQIGQIAQPTISSVGKLNNITSLGTLSNLTVTGTITGGTFSGTLSKGANVVEGKLIPGNIIAATTIPINTIVSGSNVMVPSFPGGYTAWRTYLTSNLDKDIVKNHGAPNGVYTVFVYFMVDPEGKLSNIRAENDPGFGSKKEALRLIQKSPKWKPAELNGKPVHMGYRQAVSFFVANNTIADTGSKAPITVVGYGTRN